MPELSETTEVNETPEVSDETEGMDADFEAELDGQISLMRTAIHIFDKKFHDFYTHFKTWLFYG